MKAKAYKDIERLLIDSPVREIVESALFTIERKLTLNITSKAYDLNQEIQSAIAIKRLRSLLKALN